MTGEAVYGKTTGCAALVTDRMRWVAGRGCDPQILHLHAPGGLKMGHSGCKPARLAKRRGTKFPTR